MTIRVPRLMIMDACVLIDYIKTDRSVLELIVKYVGEVHIISPVVDEVKVIDSEEELIELGLIIVEPELEDAFTAEEQVGATSFQDQLCLLTAKRHDFTCVTNDKNLRKACKMETIPTMWGLELIAKLHKSGGIPAKSAIDIARQIHKTNPKHITMKIVERFITIIKKQCS